MRFVSWNVNGIRAAHKKGALLELKKTNADIVGIQETKAREEQLDKEITEFSGYRSYFDSAERRKGYSGVAVFSREEPLSFSRGLGIPSMDDEGRMLTLHFKEFIFVTCYFPNGGRDEEHFKFKLKYYDEFLEKIKELEKKNRNIIFCGDLNVAHNEIDIARPKENEKSIGFLQVERAWVDRVTKAGFVDTFRFFHPKTVKYSWWDLRTFSRERNIGWRIDYFFVSHSLKNKIKKTEILDKIYGSDHCPVFLELDI